MYLTHDRTLRIIQEEEFPAAIIQLEKELSQCRQEGYFSAERYAKIYYEYFLARNPIGSVVFVHGLSEFTGKYHEFAAYFLSQGYNVFLYDQRGHGRSHRDTDRPELIHINSFDQLVRDLDAFIEAIVRPASDAPLYLYAHSMGGAVGMLYLARHGHKLTKAVLTSPLLVPRLNDLPVWIFRVWVAVDQKFRGPLAKFPLSKEYQQGESYDPAPGDSPNRVCYYRDCRDRERMYRSTPLTLGCAHQTMKLRSRLFDPEVTEAIRVPVLMLCADNDHLVRTRFQKKFAQKCAACTHEVIADSNHAFHTDCQPVLTQALNRILSFFAEP